MRCVYLQSSLSMNGHDSLRGRRLVDALKAEGDAFLLGFMVVPAGKAAGFSPEVGRDVIDEMAFAELAPDVVFIEGGLFTGANGGWKIDPAIAAAFVASGGVVIVADVEANKLNQQREAYLGARDFLGAAASYRGRESVGGYDQLRFWKGHKQILCQPDDMVISEWLRPVFDGVPEILVGLPVRLASWGSILASGNTRSTWSDATDGIPGPDNLPFASVAKRGAGFVALICGSVSSDVWLEGGPHNTRWLVNLAKFLVSQADDEKSRGRSHVLSTESVFLSHSHADGKRVESVLRILRSKHGLKTWIDHEQILPGDKLTPSLLDAVSTSTVFLLFWSATAQASHWVELEWRAALENETARVLIVQLDSTAMPSPLQDIVRIESASSDDAAIAAGVVDTLQRVDHKRRIADLKAKVGATASTANPAPASERPAPKRIMSLTRTKAQRTALALLRSVPAVRVKASTLAPVATIRSNFRIDLLCYVDTATLLAGSSRFDEADIENAKRLGLVDAFEAVNVPTSMDGCLADHASTRRHLAYGGHDVTVVHRSDGTRGQPIRCDDGASVHSAAWDPEGERIAVASTNYLTVAKAAGNILLQDNRYPDTALSVAWAPSKNLICGSLGKVCVLVNEKPIWEWAAGPKDATRIACVAVSPCARLFACSLRNGQVKVWNEKGRLLLEYDGATGDPAYWHASRALGFSADSRILAQAAPVGSEGFSVLDLTAGLLTKVAERGTDLVAWSPSQPDLLATAADKTISFWRVDIEA